MKCDEQECLYMSLEFFRLTVLNADCLSDCRWCDSTSIILLRFDKECMIYVIYY